MKQYIESSKNKKYKFWQTLTESRGIKKHGHFILSGAKLVNELLASHSELFSEVLLKTRHPTTPFLNQKNLVHYQLKSELFNELDVLGTDYPLLVGKCPTVTSWDSGQKPKSAELFCPLGDPNNLGALLRSAEAFGFSHVILLKEACSPFHPKALRASAGSALRLKLSSGPSIHSLEGSFVALDMNGTPLNQHKWEKTTRLLIGQEGQGIPNNLNLQTIKIPINARVESLNATVAASIAMHSHFVAIK